MFGAMTSALTPVVFLMFLGWFGGLRGYFRRQDVDVMAALVMRYALPFSLFLGALATPPDKLHNLPFILCMLFGFGGTYLVAYGLGRFAFRHDRQTSAVQALVCTFPDMAYFGAPILASVCGPSGFLAVLTGNLLTSFLVLPLTILLTRGGEDNAGEAEPENAAQIFGRALLHTLTNPMVWLPLLGLIMSLLGLRLPTTLENAIDLIARSAGGISLLALGLMFFGERPRLNADITSNVAIKNVFQPALMVLGTVLFGVTRDFAVQALIVGAVPTAIAASMFAVRQKSYIENASGSVLTGTLLAVLIEAILVAYLA